MSKATSFKWRTILGLILIYPAFWFNWQWMWGILFLVWVIPDLFSGTTYFLEQVSKKEEPVLYWVIVVSWSVMSVWSFAAVFVPSLNYYG